MCRYFFLRRRLSAGGIFTAVMSKTATTRRKRRPDPVVSALRRLLTATDRSIAAADEVRRARVELAKVTGDNVSEARKS